MSPTEAVRTSQRVARLKGVSGRICWIVQQVGEARGFHVHEIEDEAIVVRTYLWERGDFALAAERRFLRA